MKINRKSSFVLLLVLLTLMGGVACVCMGLNDDGERLKPEGGYVIVNRWEKEDGRKVDLSQLEITQAMTVSLKAKRTPPPSSKLLFQTEHLQVTAVKRGKILFRSSDEAGRKLVAVPLDEVSAGDTLLLRLTPYEKNTGSILSPVRITTSGDWLFTYFYRHRLGFFLLLMLYGLTSGIALTVFLQLLRGKKHYAKGVYLVVFFALLCGFFSFRTQAFQLLLSSSLARELLTYTALYTAPLPLFCFLFALRKTKSRCFDLLCVLLLCYTAVRIVLLLRYAIPMDRGLLPLAVYPSAAAVIIRNSPGRNRPRAECLRRHNR